MGYLRDSNDINVSLLNREQQLMHIMSESIPKSNFPKKLIYLGCQKSLIQAMSKHNYLYRRAKRTGIPRHMDQYSVKRNLTVTMICNAKKAFFNKLNTADKKLFWKTIKYLRKEQRTVPVLPHDGLSAHNDNDKVNILKQT